LIVEVDIGAIQNCCYPWMDLEELAYLEVACVPGELSLIVMALGGSIDCLLL